MIRDSYEKKKIGQYRTDAPPRRGRLVLRLLGAVLVIVTVWLSVSALCNNWRTPLRTEEKLLNNKYRSYLQYELASQNGLFRPELRPILRLLRQSEIYQDILSDSDDALAETREKSMDAYGNHYRVRLVVTDKTPLTRGELSRLQSEFRTSYMEECAFLASCSEDFNGVAWGEAAAALGLSKADAKKLLRMVDELGEAGRRLRITEGYELEVTQTVTGDDLDMPEETDAIYTVLKINGRWVCAPKIPRGVHVLLTAVGNSAEAFLPDYY